MVSRFLSVLLCTLCIGFTSVAAAQTVGLNLAQSKNCMSCHRVDRKVVGPSLTVIAERFAGQEGAQDYLAQAIRDGGRGRWGPVPMPAQPQVSTNVQLNIAVPNLPTPGISIAVTPTLAGLTAAEAPAVAAAAPSAPAAPAASGPSTAEEVSPLVDIPPNYPQRALAAGIEGEVTLAFTITPDGRVENLRVTHAQPKGVFEREARRAASRWRFAPRRENGQPVAREATKTLYFRLEGR